MMNCGIAYCEIPKRLFIGGTQKVLIEVEIMQFAAYTRKRNASVVIKICNILFLIMGE